MVPLPCMRIVTSASCSRRMVTMEDNAERLLALGRKAKAEQDEQWQETIARSTQQVPPAFQRGANKEQN